MRGSSFPEDPEEVMMTRAARDAARHLAGAPDLDDSQLLPAASEAEVATRTPQPLTNLTEPVDLDGVGFTKNEMGLVFSGYEDRQKYALAKAAYFKTPGITFQDLASMYGITVGTIALWARNGGWAEQMAELIATENNAERLRIAKLRAERLYNTAVKQLNASEKIREKAMDMLDVVRTPAHLKSVAEAAKLAADMEARILGVADTGVLDTVKSRREEMEEKSGKQPLVVVFNGDGGLPPIRKSARPQAAVDADFSMDK